MNRGFMGEKYRNRLRLRMRMARALAILALFVACVSPAHAQIQPQGSDAEELTLKRAVALALQNSRELSLARLQYTVALNHTKLDLAEVRPNIYTGLGGIYSEGIPQTPGGSAPSIFSI